jgi:hypothetical protein
MAQMPNQAESGYADLVLMIERCRRLARQTSDPLTQAGLLELAAEYEARTKLASNPSPQLGSVIHPLPSHLSHRAG